jgi:uncharacterized membrane protein
MATAGHGLDDQRVEQWIGNLLRAGVLTAAAVVFVGALLYLAQHGDEPADYSTFRGEPSDLRIVGEIVAGALTLDGREVIQLGILLLIATPVARVILAAGAFALERDRLYVVVTLVVLGVLLASLTGLRF